MADLAIDFCGEWYEPSDEDTSSSIGREGDLEVDDNPYLHRQFLQVARYDGIWWLSNVGSMLSATIADASRGMQAWLAPGARIPLVFSPTNVIFTAGRIHLRVRRAPAGARRTSCKRPATATVPGRPPSVRPGAPPIPSAPRRRGPGRAGASPRGDRFQRHPFLGRGRQDPGKSDPVQQKAGQRVRQTGQGGGRGPPRRGGEAATNRRARLVEHAVTSHLVTAADPALLLERFRAETSGSGEAAGAAEA